MTREELIECLTLLKGQARNSGANTFVWDIPVDSFIFVINMAIKALGQKPMLDKIRAEIHATAEMHEDGDYYLRDEWIDEIIDKYKAESEDKE